MKLKSHAGGSTSCPALRASFFPSSAPFGETDPGSKTLSPSNHLRLATAGNFSVRLRGTRAAGRFRALRAQRGVSAPLNLVNCQKGEIWVQTAPLPPALLPVSSSFCGQQQRTSAPHPQLGARLKVRSWDGSILLLLEKGTVRKSLPSPPIPSPPSAPVPPSVTPFHLRVPPSKSTHQAPEPLEAGFDLGTPGAGSGEALRGPRTEQGPEPGRLPGSGGRGGR